MREHAMRRLALVVGSVFVLGACGQGAAPPPVSPTPTASPLASPASTSVVVDWPAPPDPMERAVAAGLKPQPREFLDTHVHAHLDVVVDGHAIVVPAGIGIDIDNPGVRRFDEPGGVAYGGIQLCAGPCISPLHTHDQSGILHTESASATPNTLGEFFVEWGVPLSDACVGDPCAPGPVAVFVNGERHTGDPRTIQLLDQTEIAIVLGTPPATIPSTADFSGA